MSVEELYAKIPTPVLIGLLIAGIIIYILLIVAEWRILTKAGEKGWKSLIPVYNVFVSHEMVGMSHIWFIVEVVCWIIEAVFEILKITSSAVILFFGIFVLALTSAAGVIHLFKLCDSFGKGWKFKIISLIVPYFSTLVLAYGKAEYRNLT